MTTYILRRILQAIPIMFLLSVFLFGVVYHEHEMGCAELEV